VAGCVYRWCNGEKCEAVGLKVCKRIFKEQYNEKVSDFCDCGVDGPGCRFSQFGGGERPGQRAGAARARREAAVDAANGGCECTGRRELAVGTATRGDAREGAEGIREEDWAS
jgi:hypothetical protein